MNKKQHIKADYLLLGYSIPEVHRLIDSLSALNSYGSGHRRIGHNWAFLRYIREYYGKNAFNVAFLHLLIDLDVIMDRKELIRYI
ncbi:MAG: hypothetical protein BV457_05390 [Thermoplasmata archaeon M9B1D]|nr:MAG: hypothetical protein BV457_05390 [Thermoplasmata archaeon M9B1D]